MLKSGQNPRLPFSLNEIDCELRRAFFLPWASGRPATRFCLRRWNWQNSLCLRPPVSTNANFDSLSNRNKLVLANSESCFTADNLEGSPRVLGDILAILAPNLLK